MSVKRVRHLPAVSDGELLGIVSIGDLVKSIISDRVRDRAVGALHPRGYHVDRCAIATYYTGKGRPARLDRRRAIANALDIAG